MISFSYRFNQFISFELLLAKAYADACLPTKALFLGLGLGNKVCII